MLKQLLITCCLATGVASAQQWELGVIGGYGFSSKLTASAPGVNADTGIRRGSTIGVFGGGDTHQYWSGEIRYLYRNSDLKLSSGSVSAPDFEAHTHIISADFLGHFRPRESHIRPFVAFGGGVKVLVGTGTESSTQPLGNLVALTATKETLGMVDVGAGVKIILHRHVRFRVEMRDFISPAPTNVIAPAPGATVHGIMNDIQVLGAFSLTW